MKINNKSSAKCILLTCKKGVEGDCGGSDIYTIGGGG